MAKTLQYFFLDICYYAIYTKARGKAHDFGFLPDAGVIDRRADAVFIKSVVETQFLLTSEVKAKPVIHMLYCLFEISSVPTCLLVPANNVRDDAMGLIFYNLLFNKKGLGNVTY